MTHDFDQNLTTPQGTEGEGFVMWYDGLPVVPRVTPQPEPPREVLPDIEEDVADLERLLR